MRGNELEIRTGTVDDVDAYVEFFIESAKYHSDRDSRFKYVPSLGELIRGFYTSQCDSMDSWTGFAVLGKRIIGYIIAIVRQRGPIHETKTIGLIEGLYVKPDLRNQGIGNRLWSEALQWLKNRKIDIIHLSVASENPLAFDFWRNKGFRPLMYQMEMKLENSSR